MRHGPPKSTSTSIEMPPNAATSVVCGCPMTPSANAKTAGTTIAARAALFKANRPGSEIRSAAAQFQPRESLILDLTLRDDDGPVNTNSDKQSVRVGLLGVGLMSSAMGHRLLDQGIEVIAWDHTPDHARA